MSSLDRRVSHARRGGEGVLGDHRREGILAAAAAAVVGSGRALERPLGSASAVELGQLGERRSRRRFRETDLEANGKMNTALLIDLRHFAV